MKQRIIDNIQDSITSKKAVLETLVPSIEKAAQIVLTAIGGGQKILFFGNGGSASDSQHLAAEFVGRYEKERRALASIALTTDTSILTAVGNDYSFDHIFERQIEALGRPGDVAVGISTSGNSKNVVQGIAKAKALGLKTIVFTGRSGGALKNMADLVIVIPSQKTSRIQECHIMIGHILCELVDEGLSC
ncbi:MAG: D-sedoheptulose 7-phosphate isomerase [Candidatus Omnitrophica bacterium]|nr:D-sedoheptulose 7-phosphate isomerase [Candidatus Omnitrophota bacterium]